MGCADLKVVERGYADDKKSKLRSETYQNNLANALINGIQKYFAANPPMARNRQI